MSDLTDEQRQEILDSIRQGNKIQAIKIFRDVTGAGLKESKEFVEELTSQLIKDDPESMQTAKAGCGAAMVLFVVGIGGLVWSQFV
ncbi:ribosomal protein L7/L12 [bacterium]|jgi:ribosomal protein L7/L12|nr:hypothetical protein [Planctomicrobium sp.]MDA7528059.1 ribosomal protein L7/L12 [bacterium]